MKFQDIEQFPFSGYSIDVGVEWVPRQLADWGELGMDLDPEYQRQHVWTMWQRVKFMEFLLRGGESGRNIYFNCVGWHQSRGPIELIDGKQRLETVLQFLNDKVKVFGGYTKSDIGKIDHVRCRLKFHVHTFQKRSDTLKWYIDFNAGGTGHTKAEIAKVRTLYEQAIKEESK